MLRSIAFINPSVSSKNIGDLFINDSVKRILVFDPQRSCDIDPRKPIGAAEIEQINRCQAAVIVGTCLWYKHIGKPSRWNFSIEELKRIRVPIIPLGVGAYRNFDDDNSFDDDTREQIRIIHSSCALSSARDLRTVEVLNEAGIQNTVMTACPTLFRNLQPHWKLVRNANSKRIAVTVRRNQSGNVRVLIRHLRARGCEPVIAAQGAGDGFMQNWIPLIQKPVETLCEYNVAPYLKLIDDCAGAIGWRLHGNMIHLAANRPAILFSTCSRGESFCQSFDLPTVRSPDKHKLPEREIVRLLDAFFDDASFAKLPGHFAAYRENMIRFLNANGLSHKLAESDDDKPAAVESAG